MMRASMTTSTLQTAALRVDARCTLGEGAVWCSRRRAILWTDIEGARLWLHAPHTGTTLSWALPDRAGAFALCESGRVLLGLANGLAFADIDAHTGPSTLAVTPVAPIDADEPRTRVNDGRTDREGRFVFGTMNEADGHADRLGHFYQFSLAHGLRRLNLDGVSISNSICFSPDGRTMYFTDSIDGTILQADYDSASARVSRVRPFVRGEDAGGMPDGSVVDAEGALWNAVWGGGRVRRYLPDGAFDREVIVAAPNTTCPAFGGADLTDLYVTSSRLEMDAAALARFPHAGGLFCAATGIRGLADPAFDDRV
jgi:L-arabinonolactonase